MTETLADHVKVAGRFARSANLERDVTRPEPLEGYIVTARALDVIERVVSTAASGPAGGAWSLTGPYGSGKSSLALLLDAALGPQTEIGQAAFGLIAEASSAVGELVTRAHQRHDTAARGFHRGLVTAAREPLSHTVLRALHAAVLRSYGKIPSASRFPAAKALRTALDDAATDDPRRTGPSPSALVEIARCLAEDAPLLLIIDEFGKNLEAISDGGAADPYLLQQLAEAGQGLGLPLFVLTLQHLSFEDYLAGTGDTQRREWAKVQGRFEDVAFVESPTQTRALIGSVFDVAGSRLQARIADWAQAQIPAMRALGVTDLTDPDVVASCYPLHPLAALVLPELCSRYGQHERTLFSFLTGPDPASAASFLNAARIPRQGPLPSLGLDAVYDYFVAGGAVTAMSTGQASRWTEIATRLRDTHGLSDHQARLAKTIAILNLISTTGSVRASRRVLTLATTDQDTTTTGDLDATLDELENAGLITFRDFADEFRIWNGTDVDIRHLLHNAHQRVRRQPFMQILSSIHEPQPVVAARHSAEHDVLRVFAQRYADPDEQVEPPDASSPYDGEVLLVVGSDRSLPAVSPITPTTKPTVAALPEDIDLLDKAGREVAAITEVLADPEVADDWVARRELGERLAQARIALGQAAATTFSSDSCRWTLIATDGPVNLPSGRGTAALSAAADLAYPSTPTIRNEMLNRTDLTSQGAKARRLVLEAMIEHGEQPDVGFTGYGPEVAMYRAVIERTGLHRRTSSNTYVFDRPTDPALRPAWEILESQFKRAKARRINLNDIHAALLSPPIGMKAAVIPVFLTAALLAYNDEIAIYEHGTFKPLLTSELSERMVRNPAHFDIKHFSNTTGARRQVLEALAERLGIEPGYRKHRVSNVLAIVGHLVSHVRTLDNYTLRTSNLTPTTLRARDALVSAVEPDQLLFVALPAVFGLRAVPTDTKTYKHAGKYAEQVGDVLNELLECHNRLLTELHRLLLDASAETSRLAIMGQAAALEDEVLDPEIRAFVLTLANDSVDKDIDWINAIATVVAKKAPSEWTDDDERRFRRLLPEQVVAFQRLVALHAEQKADGGGPFSALRVTITRSDGNEHVRLVSVDANHRAYLNDALDKLLEALTDLTGSPQRAQKALLALLGERLLPEPAGADNEIYVNISQERAQHV